MDDIDQYVLLFAAVAPGIREVWLIGSRANGTAGPESDWDLLVFGDALSLAQLQAARELHRDDVDCLVLVDGDRFKSAWGSEDKGLTLSGLQWQRLSPNRAIYTETKWREAEDGAGVISRERNAICKWPAVS